MSSSEREHLLSVFRAHDASGSGSFERERMEAIVGRIVVRAFLARQGKANQGTLAYEEFIEWLYGGMALTRPERDEAVARTVIEANPAEAWYVGTRSAIRFRNICSYSQVGWIRVRFLRDLRGALEQGRPMLRRQDLPEEALIVGHAPPRAKCWVVSHPWLAKQHADITGEQILEVIDKLDMLGASDEDVVFYDYLSMFQNNVDGTNDRSPEEMLLFKRSLKSINDLYTSPLCHVIIISSIPESAKVESHEVDIQGRKVRIEPNSVPYVNRGWCFFELFVTLLFRRHTQLDANCVAAIKELVSGLCSKAAIEVESDRDLLKTRIVDCLTSMEEQCHSIDRDLCSLIDDGTFTLVKVGYLRTLLSEGQTIPHRQKLPPEAAADWRGRRLFAALYTHLQGNIDGKTVFDPDRVILSDLVEKLDLLQAGEEDGVFFGWASFLQGTLSEAECKQRAVAMAHLHFFYMSRRFQTLVCNASFQQRGFMIHERGYTLMLLLASAFTGSLIYAERLTVDILVEHIFMVALREKVFTNGKTDMELVGSMFRELLYQRAGMSEIGKFLEEQGAGSST